MEDKKYSIKDKIALFNQFTSIPSKNENNSKKSLNSNKGFNVLEKKFPELKNVKNEEKKEIKFKNEEKKEINQKEEKTEKEIKKDDIKEITNKRKEELKKEENFQKKIEEKIEKKEENVEKQNEEKIDKKEEFKTEKNIEQKNEDNNEKNIIKEKEDKKLDENKEKTVNEKEEKIKEKKEFQEEKNLFNEKREIVMNFLVQQDKTIEVISKNKNNNNNEELLMLNSEQNLILNSDKGNIQKINCHLNKPLSLEMLKELEKIITTTILIIEKNNEDIKNKTIILRRYNEETIKLGKQFFKNRYLNKKIQSILQNEKNKKENNTIRLFDIEKIKKQYLKLYLNKVEKAIFCFNLKTYMDSYNILLSNEIIETLEEFGEFLLVVNGFDKFILGEFLAKTKKPNENNIILKSFINSINFKNTSFIRGFKFFLTRLNLPKDANLILDIMNYFSIVFYNDNINTKLYKDANSIYLLCSTTLAVNTMFVRTDIKNINKITKEQFIEMNNEVDKDTVINIYDDLKKHNIIWIQDYNEAIYRRLGIIVKEKESDNNTINEKNNNNNENNSNNNNDNNDEMNDQEYEKRINEYKNRYFQERKTLVTNSTLHKISNDDYNLLIEGEYFYKFINKFNNGENKYIKLTNDLNIVMLEKKDTKKLDLSKSINILDIKDVIMGIHNSNLNIDESEDKNLFFSIITKDKIFNFKGKNIEIVAKWHNAIKNLLNAVNNLEKKNDKKCNEENKKINSLIDNIWISVIKNWDFYGNFFLSQIKSKRNYNYNLYKTLNIDEENDEKKINLKDIYNKITNNKKITKQELFYIYENGIPKKLRNKIWSFLIGNKCGITKDLFNYYLKKIEQVDFIELGKNYVKNQKIKINNDESINKLINDILNIGNLFNKEIINCNLVIFKVMDDLYKIIRVFFLYRPDIIYNENILFITMIFLLNGENCYNSFCNLVNLIFQNYLGKFYLKDNFYISNFELFLSKILKKFCPKGEEHLEKFEIIPYLFYSDWFESLFSKILNYELIIKLWDLFLLKGEFILYQSAVAFIILEEENILYLTINEILDLFQKITYNNKIDNIFGIMKKINIEEDYNLFKISYELIKKKNKYNYLNFEE